MISKHIYKDILIFVGGTFIGGYVSFKFFKRLLSSQEFWNKVIDDILYKFGEEQ